MIAGLRARGHEVVLAHPERCPAFHRDLDALARLTASGVVCSITAGSLVGRFGRDVQRFALALVEAGLVHNVASDAHDATRRPPGLADELRARAWTGSSVDDRSGAAGDSRRRAAAARARAAAEVRPARSRRASRWLRRR